MAEVPKIIDHNRYTAIAAVLGGAFAIWMAGCQSVTKSPFSGQDVNRDQLNADIVAFNAKQEAERQSMVALVAAAEADLDRQDVQRQFIVDTVQSVAEVALAPYGLAGLAGVVTIGIGADNRRKNGLIKDQKAALAKVGNNEGTP